MAIYTPEQIGKILTGRPNKPLIEKGKAQADKYMLHVHGVGMNSAIKRIDNFENQDIHAVRKEYATSNKDLFGRLLQQEDMIFAAKGGSKNFGLKGEREQQMNDLLEDVRYGLSLRKWIKTIALNAYRCDPMGVIFMEVDQVHQVAEGDNMVAPKAYPTYKSIYSIFDYLPNGRNLEYICFKLTVGEAISFGIEDANFKDAKPGAETEYYRFCDDEKDIIVKLENEMAVIATNTSHENPISNPWGRTPAFIISDLMLFYQPQVFVSPLDLTIELADSFLKDRSIRDLQKMYHGFAKAVEPLLTCSTCSGTGLVANQPCPDCTPAGAKKGTGYKLRTKISDVAKFPLDILKETSFDFRKIFGYVSPDIAGWEKQDTSLADLEDMINYTYWGSHKQTSAKEGKGQKGEETATAKFIDTQPVYSKLNMTADWAEKTENLIADFIGQFWLEGEFKKSSIAYGRYYVLEGPDELMLKYQEMRTKGAPEYSLDEALEKYYHAMYQNNPVQLAIYVKLLKIEPFPHLPLANAKTVIGDFHECNKKIFFGEWYRSLRKEEIFSKDEKSLIALLDAYVKAKKLKEPEPEKKGVPA